MDELWVNSHDSKYVPYNLPPISSYGLGTIRCVSTAVGHQPLLVMRAQAW